MYRVLRSHQAVPDLSQMFVIHGQLRCRCHQQVVCRISSPKSHHMRSFTALALSAVSYLPARRCQAKLCAAIHSRVVARQVECGFHRPGSLHGRARLCDLVFSDRYVGAGLGTNVLLGPTVAMKGEPERPRKDRPPTELRRTTQGQAYLHCVSRIGHRWWLSVVDESDSKRTRRTCQKIQKGRVDRPPFR